MTKSAMPGTIRQLTWDSEFFGIPVAAVTLDDPSQQSIQALPAQMHNSQIRLAYLAVNQEDEATATALTDIGAIKVSQNVEFAIQLDSPDCPVVSKLPGISRYNSPKCTSEMIDLAYEAGRYSRFHTDENVTDQQYRQLYQTWAENSVNGTMADAVYVAKSTNNRVIALVTVKVEKAIGSIGLIAVAPDARGSGLGTTLIQAAHVHYANQNCAAATVVTQLANSPACRLYRRMGYEVRQVIDYYHMWLTEPGN